MNTSSHTQPNGISNGSSETEVEAFSRLFHQHRNKLYAFVLALCKSPHQAEDIVQDVFAKVWQHRADFTDVVNIEAYMMRMAHNHCINVLKRMARESALVSKVNREESVSSAEQEVNYREARDIVSKAIEHLPKQQKQVYLLSREMGYKQEEISHQMQISVPTVKSHMTQALKFLRAQCKSLFPLVRETVK